MTDTEFSGNWLTNSFTTVVLPEPEPPAIPMTNMLLKFLILSLSKYDGAKIGVLLKCESFNAVNFECLIIYVVWFSYFCAKLSSKQ